MKKFTLFLIAVAFSISMFGQSYNNKAVVQVLEPQTFYLNGQIKATISGKNQTDYIIKLPKNTKQWYYSFSTSKEETPQLATNATNLLSQIAKFIANPALQGAAIASQIMTSVGTGVCDIYLINEENITNFRNKKPFQSEKIGSRENYKDGSVMIPVNKKDNSDLYLCFRNPSQRNGVWITFEAVAIIEEDYNGEKAIIPVSENSIKAKTYGDMGRCEYEKDNYDKAMDLYLKALDIAKSDEKYDVSWIYENIGLLNLINKDINSSIDNYSKAISLLSNTNYKYYKSQIKAYKKDLKKLKKKHKELEGIDTIMSMLESNQK